MTSRKPDGSSNRYLWAPFAVACALAAAPVLTPSAAANRDAPAQRAKAGSDFRARAMGEMESVLGAPIETHQDAINAAYLSVGWTWGEDTPDELDDAAYRKAWSWGFRIEEFAETRGERFAFDHLSSSALRPGDVSSAAPRELVSRAKPAHTQAGSAGESEGTGGLSEADHERIADVELRVARAQQEIARIGEQISELEQRSTGGTKVDPGEQRAELDALNRSLEDSHDTLGALQLELRAVVGAVQRQ